MRPLEFGEIEVVPPAVYWYRYVDYMVAPMVDEWENAIGEGVVHIRCDEYRVISETPKGVWLEVDGKRKFVLRGARKTFAHPTKFEALQAFWQRKLRQQDILKQQLRRTREAYRLAGIMLTQRVE